MFSVDGSGVFDPVSVDSAWTIKSTVAVVPAAGDTPLVSANPHRIFIAFGATSNSALNYFNTSPTNAKSFFPASPISGISSLMLSYSQCGGLVAQAWFLAAGAVMGTSICITEVLWLPKGGS